MKSQSVDHFNTHYNYNTNSQLTAQFIPLSPRSYKPISIPSPNPRPSFQHTSPTSYTNRLEKPLQIRPSIAIFEPSKSQLLPLLSYQSSQGMGSKIIVQQNPVVRNQPIMRSLIHGAGQHIQVSGQQVRRPVQEGARFVQMPIKFQESNSIIQQISMKKSANIAENAAVLVNKQFSNNS